MAIANPSTVNLSEGIQPLFYWISSVTHFWFGRMITVAIFVMFMMGYLRVKEDDIVGALAVSSYVTFILGMIFWVLGLLTGLDFAIVIGVTALSSVLLLTQKKDN